MKEYTRDITVIVLNMFTFIDVKSRLYIFIWNGQKRRMLYNIGQIKNNATHYIFIMKNISWDITIIVSNMFTYNLQEEKTKSTTTGSIMNYLFG